VLSGLLASTASAVDHFVGAAVVRRSLRAAAPRLREHEEWPDLDAIAAAYDREEYLTEPALFFGHPAPANPSLRHVRPLRSAGEVASATWPSGTPFHEGVAAAYLSHAANRTAHARLFLHHRRAAAAVILVHGYRGGQGAVEERVWPIRGWFDRGFDVALMTLPFHGVRATGSGRPPLFPSADPRLTNEGIRQTIGDLRALLLYFQARGTRHVGAMGMSLGGYAVALLATLEPALDFVVPVVPLADLSSFALGDSMLAPFAPFAPALSARARVHRVVSPLARPPLLPPDRVLVIGAQRDGIAPMHHARALARHFGAKLVTFPGGHLLQFGRAAAFREIDRLLERSRA
jgi:dienelactone hydrolase